MSNKTINNKVQLFIFTLSMMTPVQFVYADAALAEDAPDERPFRSAEIGRQSIRISSDGSGIIDDFSCTDCGFKLLKVNTETVGYFGNEVVNVVQLVKQSKADVGIAKYAINSNTVYEIRFSH